MIVRRRRSLAIGFLSAAALLLSTGPIGAQKKGPTSPGQHEPLTGGLSTEQVKSTLNRFSNDGMPNLPPQVLELLNDPKQMERARELLKNNPELLRKLEELGKKFRENGGKNSLTAENRKELEKLGPPFDQMFPRNAGPNPIQPGNPIPPGIDKPEVPGDPKPIDPKGPNGFPKLPPLNPPMPGPNQQPFPQPPPMNPANPFDANETPRDRAARAAASLWERNIGPLDETPEVKKALLEFVEGTDDIFEADGKSFWESLALEQGDATSLSELLDGAALGESWTFPKFDLPSLNWSSSDHNPDIGSSSSSPGNWWQRTFGDRSPSSSAPRAPSGSGSGGFNFGVPGLEGSWLPVVLLGVLLFGSLLIWRFWGMKWSSAASAFHLGGPGWPIDPRRITTREHVVLAFEYLSVLICGPSAKTWTHNTIAGALTELAATHGAAAIMLARLYELARYAPLDEPLTTAELAEARRLVCNLAGLENE